MNSIFPIMSIDHTPVLVAWRVKATAIVAPLVYASAIACLALAFGCVSSQPMSLEDSIDILYRAEKAHDWKMVWALAHPMLKKEAGPYNEYVKVADEREDNLISWRILRMEEISDQNQIYSHRGTKAVMVSMDVTICCGNSKEATKAEDQTDYWVQQQNGRWLWYYRGWP